MNGKAARRQRRSGRARAAALALTIGVAGTAAALALDLTGPVGVPRLCAARADTDHVRELAKNDPKVLVVVSGPEAEPLGQALAQSIRRHEDFQKKRRRDDDVRVLSVADAEKALGAGGADVHKLSLIFLLAGRETGDVPLPPRVASLLPVDAGVVRGTDGVLRSAKDRDDPGKPVFRVAACAPDGERLRRLLDLFTARKVGNFRDLPFERRFRSNRVAVFSHPKHQPLFTGGWGALPGEAVWNDVRWYPLSERDALPGDALVERAQVYFVDRSADPTASLPAPVAALLAGQTLRPTSVVAVRSEGVSVVSAPTGLLLSARARRYRSVEALETMPASFEAADLRRVGVTALMIPSGDGAAVRPEHAALLYDAVAKDLREQLGVTVQARGPVLSQLEREVQLQSLQGATGTAKMLRTRLKTRYLWLFRLSDFGGTTEYRPVESKLTPDLPPFTEIEPEEPLKPFRKESSQDFNARRDKWRKDHAAWRERRREYDARYEGESCRWEQKVLQTQSARARGLLQLWDLETPQGAQPIWEKECAAGAGDTRDHRVQVVSLRGHRQQPGSLDTPGATPECEFRYLGAAARDAARQALAVLVEEALLPDAGAAASATVADTGDAGALEGGRATATAVSTAAAEAVKIADIDGRMITLTAGGAQGVRSGDRFTVPLQAKEIRDPDTGRVISVRVLDSLALTVVRAEVGAADCAPATPADAAKLSRLRVGMPAWKLPPAPAPAAKPAPKAKPAAAAKKGKARKP